MRKPETCKIEYCGYGKPKDKTEIEFEILGLKQAIKSIEQNNKHYEETTRAVYDDYIRCGWSECCSYGSRLGCKRHHLRSQFGSLEAD